MGDRPVGVAAERRPSRPARRSARPAPMSTVASIVSGSSVGSSVDEPVAGVGEDQLVVEIAAARRERLGEAADAVAAHLGPAAVGVVQHHPRRVAGFALARPAARRRRRRVAGRTAAGRAPAGRLAHVGVEHDEEVVAESVVLGEGRHVVRLATMRSLSVSAASTAGAASATGSCSMSIQRTRGSRRNHRVLADGELAGAHDRSGRPPRRASTRRRGGRAAPCSRAPGRPCATGRARRARAPRRAGRRAIIACTRRSIRAASTGAVPAQADLGDRRRRVRVEARAERAERAAAALAHLERPHDAAARWSGSIRAAATGSSVGQAGVQRLGPELGRLGLEPGADVGPLPRQVEVVDRRSVVEPGAADEQRPAAACRRDRRARVAIGALELGDGELVRRLDEVEQVVRHRGAVGGASAWRCRCPSPGTPASSRSTTSSTSPSCAATAIATSTCPTRSARRRRPAQRASPAHSAATGMRMLVRRLGDELDEAARRGGAGRRAVISTVA